MYVIITEDNGVEIELHIQFGVNATGYMPSSQFGHVRTPSGGRTTNKLASHTSEEITTTQHLAIDHFAARKAVDLLAPTVLQEWQSHRIISRRMSVQYDIAKTGRGLSKNADERPQHFRDLLEQW